MRVLGHHLLFVVMVKVVMSLGETTLSLEVPIRHPDCQGVDDLQHPIFLANPNNCNKYYSCKNGFANPLSCPNNLQFSVIHNRCDYPEVAKCNVASTPAIVPPKYQTTLVPSTIYSTSSIRPLPHTESSSYDSYPGDCNRFIRYEVMRCPSNFHWNAPLQRCDLPNIAACRDSLVPDTTGFPSTTISIAGIPTAATAPPPFASTITSNPFETPTESELLNELCSNSSAKYLHYPNDCHKFIQCNGIAFVQTCAAGLFWNEQLTTCDRYCK